MYETFINMIFKIKKLVELEQEIILAPTASLFIINQLIQTNTA